MDQRGIDFAAGRLVTSEEKQDVECTVKGNIPSWLQGEVIRNGPGEFKLGPDKFAHIFDGHAFIHKFRIEDGKVTYSGKFVKSEMLQANREHNRLLMGGFGSRSYPDPCKNMFSRLATYLTTSPKNDNCNVNIATIGDAHYAITDGAIAYRFDPDTLETKNFLDIHEILNVQVTTAHPHFDKNGDYYNVASSFGRNSFYNVVKVPASSSNKDDPLQDLQIHARTPIDAPRYPSYHHSFGLTENYIIFVEQIYRLNLPKLLWNSATWGPVSTSFYMDDKRESQFHIFDKISGEVLPIKFMTKGVVFFHFVNSYEASSSDGKRFIVADICCLTNFRIDKGYVLTENMTNADWADRMTTTFERFVLPLDVSKNWKKGVNLVTLEECKAEAIIRDDDSVFVTPEPMLPKNEKTDVLELPRINYNYNGRKYRYFYSTSVYDKDGCGFLYKYDTKTKRGLIWKESGCIPSEAIFVERPNAADEDDGIVLSTIINQDPIKPVFMLVLDGKTFTEVARAQVNTKLSMSLHGTFNTHL